MTYKKNSRLKRTASRKAFRGLRRVGIPRRSAKAGANRVGQVIKSKARSKYKSKRTMKYKPKRKYKRKMKRY